MGALGGQHCMTGGTCGDSVAWLVPGALQRVRPGERVAWPGWHVGRGRSQPRHVFTACEPHLPGQWPSVSKVRTEQGRGRQLARPRNPAESATAVARRRSLGQKRCHAPPGLSATELTLGQQHGFCQPQQVWELWSLSGRLGRTPQSLADRLDHVPLREGWSGGGVGGCSGFGCSQHHHEAPTGIPGRAGQGRSGAELHPGMESCS